MSGNSLVVPVSATLLNLGLLLALLYLGSRTAKYREKFQGERQRFGKRLMFMQEFLTQAMVDNRLRELAAAFSKAVQNQARVLQNPHDEQAFQEAAQWVHETKEAFWKAQNSIRDNGTYEVKDSIRAYLPTGPQGIV